MGVRLPSSQGTPDPTLISQLERQGVDYRFEAPGAWPGLLLNFLPLLLLFGLPAALLAVLLAVWVRRPQARGP